MEETKTPITSKSIWTGVVLAVLGILGIIAEAWQLLTIEQQDYLGTLFGPEMVTLVGVIMVVLRVATRSPISFGQTAPPEEATEEEPSE